MEDADLPRDNEAGNRESVKAAINSGDASKADNKKEKKLGHRRVDEEGTVTYKKKPSREIMQAIQLGIFVSTSQIHNREKRDVLLTDFGVIDTISFPKEGGPITPKHSLSDFRFRVYAPYAFRHFRDLFSVQTKDFMHSLCTEELRELSNPGASGSIFYITQDDEFIIKTVQHKEASFLRKLLPEYYMNLNQNPRTLLPKYYGLFCYQCGGKNIRFVIMNNLLPSSITIHEKYDLKGSTFKRRANSRERAKASPTLKDLDFRAAHPEGLFLEAWEALQNTIERDCRVLESFRIMDYSLLLGIHNLDQAKRERKAEKPSPAAVSKPAPTLNVRPISAPPGGPTEDASSDAAAPAPETAAKTKPLEAVESEGGSGSGSGGGGGGSGSGSRSVGVAVRVANRLLQRSRSAKQRIALFSTAMESIQASSDPVELEKEEEAWVPPGGIPARNAKGERLLLYVGIIDVLQNFRFVKKLEHRVKAIAYEGDTISVHNPSFYKERFQGFCKSFVFHQVPSSMRSQAARRRAAAVVSTQESRTRSISSGAQSVEHRHPDGRPQAEAAQKEEEAPSATDISVKETTT